MKHVLPASMTDPDRLWRGGTILAAILAVTVIAAKAGEVTWHLAGEPGEPVPVPEAQQSPAMRQPADLDAIMALAPFGRQIRETGVELAQETSLGLVLQGVVAAAPADASIAMIREKSGQAEPYRIGDQVPGGATLEIVHPDHVVLRVAGRLETLSFTDGLEQASRSGGGAASVRAMLSPSAQATAAAGLPSREQAFAAAARQPVPEAASNALSADQIVDSFRKQIAANPQTVLDNLGVATADDGYEITEDSPPTVRLAGFRPGDIVTSVNGKAVGNIESDRDLFEEVVASGRARVVVMRDGKQITMSFPLR